MEFLIGVEYKSFIKTRMVEALVQELEGGVVFTKLSGSWRRFFGFERYGFSFYARRELIQFFQVFE